MASHLVTNWAELYDREKARADAAEAALAKFRMVNPARADLIEALADANARAEKAEEWRHAWNALVTQLRADLAAARRECEGLRNALDAAPHDFGCLAFTVIDGKPPLCRADPPQQFRPRIPPDLSICNCKHRVAALAAPAAGEEGKR